MIDDNNINQSPLTVHGASVNDNNSESKHPDNDHDYDYGANTLALTHNTIGNGKKWTNKDISIWIEQVLKEQFDNHKFIIY